MTSSGTPADNITSQQSAAACATAEAGSPALGGGLEGA
jgi:hypothetical protein